MAMVPHERSLVNKLEGKPFALLGVNVDNTREELKKSQQSAQITWRSWFDGRRGPIGKQWKVQLLPTIYVIDQQGVIRYEGVQGEALDRAVESLLGEMGRNR